MALICSGRIISTAERLASPRLPQNEGIETARQMRKEVQSEGHGGNRTIHRPRRRDPSRFFFDLVVHLKRAEADLAGRDDQGPIFFARHQEKGQIGQGPIRIDEGHRQKVWQNRCPMPRKGFRNDQFTGIASSDD